MTLILDNDDVLAAADMPAIVASLEAALRVEARGDVQTVPRINFKAGQAGFFRVMPAVIGELDLMGLKAFNASDDGTVRYLIGLWEVSSGRLLAMLDASHLTAIRTGAVTGVAHRAIGGAHFDQVVGVIGSGLEARTNLEAICVVGDVGRVKVFSPRPERRQAFAEEMTEKLGIEVKAVASGAEAADADAVLVATNTGKDSGVLALKAAWLKAPGHLNTIGATMRSLREVDAATFAEADTVVLDTLDAVAESGDLLAASEEGCWDDAKVRSLADYFKDEQPAAPNDGSELSVFKSVGTGLQDLVAARAIYDVARERGLGNAVDILAEKQFEGFAARRQPKEMMQR